MLCIADCAHWFKVNETHGVSCLVKAPHFDS